MDAVVEWKINDNPEDLVAAIVELRGELTTECFKKHGMQTKLLKCDVYANKKTLEILRKSELWMDAKDPDEVVKQNKRYFNDFSKMVADFNLFKLHESRIMGDEQVRVVSSFDIGESSFTQVWFGNVTLLPAS